MAYTFEEAYKEIDEIYRRSGFRGIADAADAGYAGCAGTA